MATIYVEIVVLPTDLFHWDPCKFVKAQSQVQVLHTLCSCTFQQIVNHTHDNDALAARMHLESSGFESVFQCNVRNLRHMRKNFY